MTSTGFTLAGTGANNADAGTNAWTNPGNITADDGSESTPGALGTNNSQYLHATNFGFSVPTGATIDGITARIQQRATSQSGNGTRDITVQLIQGGTRSGNNNADTVTEWPTSATNKDYGGISDLWGLTLTPADVNASTFGVALRVDGTGSTKLTSVPNVDAIWIAVEYTEGGSETPQSVSAGVSVGMAGLFIISLAKAIGVTAAASTSFVRTLLQSILAGVTAGASAVKSVARSISVAIDVAASMLKQISTTLSAAGVTVASTAVATRVFLVNLSISVLATMTQGARSITKILQPAVDTTVIAVKGISTSLSASIGIAVSLLRSVTKSLTAAVDVAAALLISIPITLTASVAVSVGIVKQIGLGLSFALSTLLNLTPQDIPPRMWNAEGDASDGWTEESDASNTWTEEDPETGDWS